MGEPRLPGAPTREGQGCPLSIPSSVGDRGRHTTHTCADICSSRGGALLHSVSFMALRRAGHTAGLLTGNTVGTASPVFSTCCIHSQEVALVTAPELEPESILEAQGKIDEWPRQSPGTGRLLHTQPTSFHSSQTSQKANSSDCTAHA